MLKIGGFVPFSLNDYPGRVAAVVFTQGCNFRCPFCHNSELLGGNRPAGEIIPAEYVLEKLGQRRNRIESVVLSGGEPTLQPGLADFMEPLRSLGFLLKLDTNGSRPQVIQHLLLEGLLDYIAMDVKAPLDKYALLSGAPVRGEIIRESIKIISKSGVAHEFRTTWVPQLHSPEDKEKLLQEIPTGSFHRFQEFRPESALDNSLRNPCQTEKIRLTSAQKISEKSFLPTPGVLA
jgi:pyruvate formate lyase activating enzyme